MGWISKPFDSLQTGAMRRIRYHVYSPFNDITSSIGLAGDATNPYRS
jgi:hypothetical protein